MGGGLGFGVILHHLGFPEHGTLLGVGCKVVQDSLHTQQTAGIEGMDYRDYTLPETNMETQKGPYKEYSPSKRRLYGFPC